MKGCNNMDDFAKYILKEKDYIQKMVITYYLSKKTGNCQIICAIYEVRCKFK